MSEDTLTIRELKGESSPPSIPLLSLEIVIATFLSLLIKHQQNIRYADHDYLEGLIREQGYFITTSTMRGIRLGDYALYAWSTHHEDPFFQKQKLLILDQRGIHLRYQGTKGNIHYCFVFIDPNQKP